MKGKWISDVCPFAKDQGFLSVVSNVESGETVFGFTHRQSGETDIINFKTKTAGKVTQMKDTDYKVIIGAIAGTSQTKNYFSLSQSRTGFTLTAVPGESYDILVIGKVEF